MNVPVPFTIFMNSVMLSVPAVTVPLLVKRVAIWLIFPLPVFSTVAPARLTKLEFNAVPALIPLLLVKS